MIRSKYFKIYKYFKKNRGFASKLQLLLLLSGLTAFSGNTITAVLSEVYIITNTQFVILNLLSEIFSWLDSSFSVSTVCMNTLALWNYI